VRDAVLIHVTEVFVLQTVEVPLPPPEHLEHRANECAHEHVRAPDRNVYHPDEADEDVRYNGNVIQGYLSPCIRALAGEGDISRASPAPTNPQGNPVVVVQLLLLVHAKDNGRTTHPG